MTVLELVKAGIINRQQATVLDYLRKNGSTSNRKMSVELSMPVNVITPRNKELRDKGYIKQTGMVYDKITNKTVRAWGAI